MELMFVYFVCLSLWCVCVYMCVYEKCMIVLHLYKQLQCLSCFSFSSVILHHKRLIVTLEKAVLAEMVHIVSL